MQPDNTPWQNSEPAAVLVVDDDEMAAQTLGDILTSQGYKVSLATRGPEALRISQQDAFSVALVDLRLTEEMSGLELLQRLKETVPHIECLVVTGHADTDTAIQSLNLGAFGYLKKPVDMHYLLQDLSRALDRHRLAKTLEQRLREVEGAARLNAQVLTERAELMEQVQADRAQLALARRALERASRATSVQELAAEMAEAVESSNYTCVVLPGLSNGHLKKVEHYRNLAPFVKEVDCRPLVQEVLRSGHEVVLDSLPGDALVGPLLAACGIRSVAALPVRTGPEVYAIICLHSRQSHAFSGDKDLLGLLADVYGVALQRLLSLQAVDRARSDWEATFNGVSEGIAITDSRGIVLRANAAMLRFLGVSRPDGRPLAELLPVAGGLCGDVHSLVADVQARVETLHEADGSLRGYLYTLQAGNHGRTLVAGAGEPTAPSGSLLAGGPPEVAHLAALE